MRIALGTLFLIPGKLGGLENYTRGLINGLINTDSKNQYIILANTECENYWQNLPDNFTIYSCQISGVKKAYRSFYERFLLKYILEKLNIDIYHSLAFGFLPKSQSFKKIITIGDIIFKHFPKDLGWIQGKVMDYSVTSSSKTADRILTFSEFSKQDLSSQFKIPIEKIDVALLANTFFQKNTPEYVSYIKENNIPKKYIFSVVSTYYHKNLKRLLEAFYLLKKEKGIEHKLVITGLKMAGHSEFGEIIQKMKLEKEIIFTGWISESVLDGLYANASCFVYPSLYEGFGLPVLEAMKAEVAVVSSNATSLPEVYGGAAFSFNPLVVEEMAENIMICLSDEKKRHQLIAKGKKQAAQFSWQKCARQTLDVYEKVFVDQ